MVDLHSHVLPGLDDGPADLVDALAMAAVAALAGTTVLAATPHVRADFPQVVPSQLAGRVADFNARLRERGIALEVVTGGEVALVDALERPRVELDAVTLGGGGTLLVETPHGPLPPRFEVLLDAVAGRGYRVLLAHPEINADFQREPERLAGVAARGHLLQITASSLATGKRSRKLAQRALARGWAHVIASDGHSPGWRPPSLSEGLTAARGLASEPVLRWMVADAPRAILAGDDLPPRPGGPPPGERRLWWRR